MPRAIVIVELGFHVSRYDCDLKILKICFRKSSVLTASEHGSVFGECNETIIGHSLRLNIRY